MEALQAHGQHTLAVLQRVGGNGRERVGVHEADEVGHGGLDLAVHHAAEVLVLEIDERLAAAVLADALQHHAAEVERPARLAQHVGDLALEQLVAARELQEELLGREAGRSRLVLRRADGAAQFLGARHDAVHAVLLAGVYVHAEQRDRQRAAHGHGGGAGDVLGPLVRDGIEDAGVALLVDERHGRGRRAADGERDHLQLGERAAHAVHVHHGNAEARGRGDGQHGVHAASFDGHGGVDGLAVVARHHVEQLGELVGAHALLGEDGGCAHGCGGHDERAVGPLVDADQLHFAAFFHGADGRELSDVRVAAPTSAEKRRAQRDVLDFLDADLSHACPSCARSEASSVTWFMIADSAGRLNAMGPAKRSPPVRR